jgi:hypothetical protein
VSPYAAQASTTGPADQLPARSAAYASHYASHTFGPRLAQAPPISLTEARTLAIALVDGLQDATLLRQVEETKRGLHLVWLHLPMAIVYYGAAPAGGGDDARAGSVTCLSPMRASYGRWRR